MASQHEEGAESARVAREREAKRRGREVTFSIVLPLPPSANRLYANIPGKGRIKTRAYKRWRLDAILSIFAQVRADFRVGGPVALSFCVPAAMRGDLDNRIKATIDALVGSRRIDDDKHVCSITILRGGADKGKIHIKAEPWK
jgi:Holliday junction resolvase RusA-like endonuclease